MEFQNRVYCETNFAMPNVSGFLAFLNTKATSYHIQCIPWPHKPFKTATSLWRHKLCYANPHTLATLLVQTELLLELLIAGSAAQAPGNTKVYCNTILERDHQQFIKLTLHSLFIYFKDSFLYHSLKLSKRGCSNTMATKWLKKLTKQPYNKL